MECLTCPYFNECNGNCVLFDDNQFNHYTNYNNILSTYATSKNYVINLKKPSSASEKYKNIKLNLEITK